MEFRKISGDVANLHVTQDEQDFFQAQATQAVGGAAAIGLAVEGLAGAATSAAISSGSMSERMDFFTCTIGNQNVWGRFGTTSFKDGDYVEAVGQDTPNGFEAYAITRPADRTIWMYPHCSRGSKAHLRHSLKGILLLCWVLNPIFILFVVAISNAGWSPWWFWPTAIIGWGFIFSIVLIFVSFKFTNFAVLSNEIFIELGFDNPTEVDLPKRLKLVGKEWLYTESQNYHPCARWVFKY